MSTVKQQIKIGAVNGEEIPVPSSAFTEKEQSAKQQISLEIPMQQIQISSTATKALVLESHQKTENALEKRNDLGDEVDSVDGEASQQNSNQKVNEFGKRAVVGKMAPFSELLKFATKRDKIFMAVGTFAAIVSGAANPFLAVVFGGMVNSFGPQSTPDQVVHDSGIASMWFAIIGAIVFLASWLMFAFWLISGENQAIEIRKRYFRALLKQEIGWFDRINPNELATQVLQQSLDIQMAIGEKVATFLQCLAQAITGFIIGYCYGWQLSLVCTAVLPALSLSSFAYFFLLQQMKMQTERIYEVAGGVAEQAIQSVKTVKCLRGEDFEAKRYEEHVREAMHRSIKFTFFLGFTQGLIYFSMFCNYALSFWYGAKLISDQTNNPVMKRAYNVGDVMIIFFAIQTGSIAIGQALPTLDNFAQGRLAGYSVFKVLDRVPKVRNEAPGVQLPNLRGNFSFQDVEFEYPAKRGVAILKKISFEIEAGKKTALVGESGSGKSTCLHLLERFYDVEKGKLLIDGVEIKKVDLDWLRDNIGYVGQEPVLFASSIRENLLFGKNDATEEEMWDALDKANAKKFVMGLEKKLDTFVGTSGSQMSGGQKQRICIARAILKNPKILLLDEATSALDRANELSIQKTLDEVSRGRTTVVVAHRLTTVRNSDKILVLDFGKVCEQGTHDELIKKGGRYETLAKNQLQGEIDAAFVTIESFANEDAMTAPNKRISFVALHDALNVLRAEADKQNKSAEVYLQTKYSDLKFKNILEQYQNRLSAHVDIQGGSFNFTQVLQIVAELANYERKAQGEEFEAILQHSAANASSTGEKLQTALAATQPIVRKLSDVLSAQSPDKRKTAAQKPDNNNNNQSIREMAEKEKTEAINRLYSYDNPEKKSLYIACVFSFLNGIFLPISAIFMAQMIFKMSDYYNPDVSHDDYQHKINDLALYYFLIAIGSLICNTGAKTMFSRVGEGLTYSVRLNVFKKIVRMPVYWFDDPEHNPGTLSVRLGSEAKVVNNLVSNVVDLQFGLFATFATALVVGFTHSWALTLIAFALAPMGILAGVLRSKWVKGSSSETDEAYKDSGNLIQESVSNIRTVVSFGNEKILLGFLDERLKKPQALIPSKSNIAGLSLGFANMTLFIIYAIVFYVGAILHRDNGLTLENMLTAVFTIIFACMRAGQNLHFAGDIGEAENAAINIYKILDALDEIQIQQLRNGKDKLLRPAKVLGEIEFKNVVFKYPAREKIILKGLSFKVAAGAKTAFVGASGCGKSTIMQILLRYYDIVSGEVLLDGQNILDYDIEYLRGYFGIVQQEPVVFQGTIAENIRYNQEDMTQEQIRRYAEQANALGFIERDEKAQIQTNAESEVIIQPGQIAINMEKNNHIGTSSGFYKQVGAKGSQISGGQKQRIAIARAIAKNPQILLLDEATSALDSENEKIVQESLDAIMKNKTTLVIAHRISTIKDSNLIIVMEEGQIVEAGNYQDLLNQKGTFIAWKGVR